ncbi:MAG: hypothetical protein DHS20C16_36730 [Phycisphaerae bacterium]|nr:MAG: hypothetical protein DHS20C16_36730 [Phycisphaerae bacterium]
MNVVDSSGWLEYFAGGQNAEFFAPAIEDFEQLLVPTICLFEVFKQVVLQFDENKGLRVVVAMQRGCVVDLDANIALNAAQLSIAHKLPMADSVILATSRAHDATLWTQDSDFKGLERVEYVEK